MDALMEGFLYPIGTTIVAFGIGWAMRCVARLVWVPSRPKELKFPPPPPSSLDGLHYDKYWKTPKDPKEMNINLPFPSAGTLPVPRSRTPRPPDTEGGEEFNPIKVPIKYGGKPVRDYKRLDYILSLTHDFLTNEAGEFQVDQAKKIAQMVSFCHKSGKNVLVICGLQHPKMEEYKLSLGWNLRMEAQVHPKAKFGCIESRTIFSKLSMQFADTLNSLGIPAWNIDCGSMIQAADGDLNKSTRKLIERQIRNTLDRECLPFLTTQFSLDCLNGCNVFTEHQLTEMCAEIFKPNYVFLFNSSGIKNNEDKIVPSIDVTFENVELNGAEIQNKNSKEFEQVTCACRCAIKSKRSEIIIRPLEGQDLLEDDGLRTHVNFQETEW